MPSMVRRPFFWIITLAVVGVRAGARLSATTSKLRESLLLAALYITLASNLNLMLGYAGYINFGSIVFFGLGGYICVWLVNSHGWPLVPSLRSPASCVSGWRCFSGLASCGCAALLRAFDHRRHRSGAGLRREFHALGRLVRHLPVALDLHAAGRPGAGALGHLFPDGRA